MANAYISYISKSTIFQFSFTINFGLKAVKALYLINR